MTVEKINEFKEVKEFLKTKKLSIYEMASIQHYFDIVDLLKNRLSAKQLKEVDNKKINIINDYNYLESAIYSEKDDLMCLVILKNLYGVSMSKWDFANYLDMNSLQELYTDEEVYNATIEEITRFYSDNKEKVLTMKAKQIENHLENKLIGKTMTKQKLNNILDIELRRLGFSNCDLDETLWDEADTFDKSLLGSFTDREYTNMWYAEIYYKDAQEDKIKITEITIENE